MGQKSWRRVRGGWADGLSLGAHGVIPVAVCGEVEEVLDGRSAFVGWA